MRKFGGLAQIASVLVLFTMLLSACGGGGSTTTGGGGSTPGTPKSNIKVALVTDTGGLNDNGFNHLADVGYTKAQGQYGFSSQVIQTASQNDYVKNLTQAARSANLVIAVGFLMQTPLDQIAKQFPNVKFAIVDGCAVPDPNTGNCETLPNVAPLHFREEQAGCLVGAIAAQMEVDGKSKVPHLLGKNTIGSVGGLNIPPVAHYIAGYEFCAKKVDPSIQTFHTFSNDFNATAKCKDAAQALISQHQADIIFQVAGGCGVGALDAANSNHVYGIGVDNNQASLYSSVITSALKHVDTSVYSIISDTENNQFSSKDHIYDLAHDGVGYAPVSSAVPADAKAKADDFMAQMQSGSLTVPAPPQIK